MNPRLPWARRRYRRSNKITRLKKWKKVTTHRCPTISFRTTQIKPRYPQVTGIAPSQYVLGFESSVNHYEVIIRHSKFFFIIFFIIQNTTLPCRFQIPPMSRKPPPEFPLPLPPPYPLTGGFRGCTVCRRNSMTCRCVRRPFLDTIYSALNCKDNDYNALLSLCLLYAMLHNKGELFCDGQMLLFGQKSMLWLSGCSWLWPF